MKLKKTWIFVAVFAVAVLTLICFYPLFGHNNNQANQQGQPLAPTVQTGPAAAQQPQQGQQAGAVAPPQAPKVVPSSYDTGLTMDQALKMQKPIAVNFYVDWCHYCQHFAPILNDLRKEYEGQMNFVLINVEKPENKQYVSDYNITGFPTLYLVNPKNDNRVFLNQTLYSNPNLLKKEFDRFLRVNK